MRDEEILRSEALRPLKRVEYERLVECGSFADERVELLRGFLVRMSPQGEPHWKSIALLNKLLVPALGDRADVVSHSPFAADEDSEPEPDLMVIPSIVATRGAPARALLVVEASDSSLRRDRTIKGPMYAASKVPEYWILDLAAGEVEVCRDPGPDGYREVTRHGPDATIALLAFPDVSVRVSAFLLRS